MKGKIKEWVEEKMKWEDIEMNLIVENVNSKDKIKVKKRKKLKCKECKNNEMM
jgi:hypothetical protein